MNYPLKKVIKPLLTFGLIIGLINNIAILLLNKGYVLISILLFLDGILVFIYFFIYIEKKYFNNLKFDFNYNY